MTTEKRKNPQRFSPVEGRVYTNAGGGKYLCQIARENSFDAWMQNTASGWTLLAHGIVRYEDGTIEWDYSTQGHFEEIRRAETAGEIYHRQISLANAMLCFLI